MKKKLTMLLAALLLAVSLGVPALADSSTDHVYNLNGLLTAGEWALLDMQAEDISERYGCGVYIVTVDDYTEYGSGSVYDVTTQIYNDADNGFGLEDGREGILLLLSMRERDWAMFVHGEYAQYAFDDYGQTELEDAFLPAFGENDWYGGFSGYLNACDEYLALAAAGTPVRRSPVGGIVTAVVISCAVALVVCLILKAKMKSVHRKVEAQTYITADGLALTDSYDRYTHTTESRRRIEKKSSSASGGGGSGRSGKF